MPDQSTSSDMLQQLRKTFGKVLHDFAASPSTIVQIVHSTPNKAPSPVKTIYILDSSFNPPSKAHELLAYHAYREDRGSPPSRIMFLLATENADKKVKPAAFEDRLVMMTLMADDLRSSFLNSSSSTASDGEIPTIDIAVTKKPFFVDKAMSLDDTGIYGPDAVQVHVTGFDTITRIFDSKYYPDDKKLRVLDPFLGKHRLRVTYRPGEKFGTRRDQDAYLDTITDGSREKEEGMRKEWREQIEMVESAKEAEGVSSTEARKACMDERWEDLDQYVGKGVAKYIREMGLYREDIEQTR